MRKGRRRRPPFVSPAGRRAEKKFYDTVCQTQYACVVKTICISCQLIPSFSFLLSAVGFYLFMFNHLSYLKM
jgi:hypothetical protein